MSPPLFQEMSPRATRSRRRSRRAASNIGLLRREILRNFLKINLLFNRIQFKFNAIRVLTGRASAGQILSNRRISSPFRAGTRLCLPHCPGDVSPSQALLRVAPGERAHPRFRIQRHMAFRAEINRIFTFLIIIHFDFS